MRVGDAVAALEGLRLRLDELDGEREERQRWQKSGVAPAADEPDRGDGGADANGVEEVGGARMVKEAAAAAAAAEGGTGVSAGRSESGDGRKNRKKPRKRKGFEGAQAGQEECRVRGGGGGGGGERETKAAAGTTSGETTALELGS